MKLLLVLFTSSLFVLSIGCGNGQELRKEVELLREEVNLLKCHVDEHERWGGGGNTDYPKRLEWSDTDGYVTEKLCPMSRKHYPHVYDMYKK